MMVSKTLRAAVALALRKWPPGYDNQTDRICTLIDAEPVEITDAMVERAAKKIDPHAFSPDDWTTRHARIAAKSRACAALTAALNPEKPT